MVPPELRDKVPPHNSEAEQAVLGAVILDPEAVGAVLRFLRPEDFYVNANREVFAGIVSLYEKGRKADLITSPTSSGASAPWSSREDRPTSRG